MISAIFNQWGHLMNATNELIQEHEGIEIMLRVLLALSEKFEKGERVPVNIRNFMPFWYGCGIPISSEPAP